MTIDELLLHILDFHQCYQFMIYLLAIFLIKVLDLLVSTEYSFFIFETTEEFKFLCFGGAAGFVCRFHVFF